MEENIIKTVEVLKKSSYAIAFTGAGISVESGIPPFRGENGLWNRYDPTILDLDFFYQQPEQSWKAIKEIFYEFFGKAKPNTAHDVLSELEKQGIIKTLITQNIDNLHQEAGSKNVIEFHGTAQTMVCIDCGHKYKAKEVKLKKTVPECKKCKGTLKPDFIFFGEGIPEPAGSRSFDEAEKCDLLILTGTTGEVMPASMIPHRAKKRGATIVEVNPAESAYTNTITDIYLKGKAGEVFGMIADRM